ncbi:C-terminal binding protein [Actinomadura madurae]|uniref:C-terminal binding protein n=1 Tax=Actinomadura madurae TaxID=1993 RepID=UPI0020D221F0|nr:C-terminal binding protein [Actinomadura madurae]MCP9953587.1 C-terminal binding protein [Actinomadura madurae]MCP9970345.1 C-terminal binding protein [Actinomadura madurae]MCP9982823.1 C-terminal binding protein [Actinomadura madurae]MCQ0005628.1 C-terminal binding protein [Actinomadura madurae]
MRVVATSTLVSFDEEDLRAYDGLDIDFEVVDGTSEAALVANTADADGLIVVSEGISRKVIEGLTRCRTIVRCGIGVDTVDLDAAAEHGIWVSNVPDANYREVAVHAIALTLAVQRRLPALDAGMRASGWADWFVPGVHRPDVQTFGLYGLGRIGRRVAEIAASLGYAVIAYDPAIEPHEGDELGVALVDRFHLLTRSDVLSLHVPLLESTRNLIDRDALALMKKGSVLVNVSRGGLIDEDALADALRSGHLFGAGIDVFATEPVSTDNPLLACETAILTPHAAHWSEESLAELKQKALEESARILRGEAPRNAVNRVRAR